MSDKGHLAFPMTRPEFPGDVAFSDGSSTRRLTRLNTDLFSQRDLGRVEEIWHKSSFDGREIQSWFVTPPDFDRSKKYPLVLEIHGGRSRIMETAFPLKCGSMRRLDMWPSTPIPGAARAMEKSSAICSTITTRARTMTISSRA